MVPAGPARAWERRNKTKRYQGPPVNKPGGVNKPRPARGNTPVVVGARKFEGRALINLSSAEVV